MVVYESTVYPGVTEDICIPILEQESGLKCGVDFKVGYSPERINPGDKVHTLRTIRKVVSGIDTETVNEISKIYDTVVDAGTYAVSSIKTAEAVKLVENSQRDINIAFMNEMSMAFERMGIDTNEVVDGMNTKWNALGFRPGLVGGHCIGVDPYYFIYEADQKGYTSKIVSMGRTVNDSMGTHIADATVKRIIQAGGSPTDSNIVILGLTFKENCPDVRNTRVIDIYKRLQEYNINAAVCDPWADPELVKKIYGIELTPLSEIKNADCIIHAVAHNEFKVHGLNQLMSLFRSNSSTNVLIDVKGQWNTRELSEAGISWWRM